MEANIAQIAAAVAGRADAREAVAARACSLALRTAAGVLGSRELAGDVAQDVAIDVMRQLPKLRHPAAFDAWVHRIAVRETLRAARRHRLRLSRERVSVDELLDRGAPPVQAIAPEQLALHDVLQRALRSLPPKQRVAVILKYVHDLTEAEIAAALGCRPGTAASLLSRARAELRTNPELEAFVRPEGVRP
jgi:RNA polymerase sigma-70 factor (ECF subfamily)